MVKTSVKISTESLWLEALLAFSKAENQDPKASIKLLWDEVTETHAAEIERRVGMSTQVFNSKAMRIRSLHAHSIEMLDGFADVAFVALSGMRKTLVEVGVPEDRVEETIHKIMRTVCAANLSKLKDGRFVKDENGKIQKPDDFVPPNGRIGEILFDAVNNIHYC